MSKNTLVYDATQAQAVIATQLANQNAVLATKQAEIDALGSGS